MNDLRQNFILSPDYDAEIVIRIYSNDAELRRELMDRMYIEGGDDFELTAVAQNNETLDMIRRVRVKKIYLRQ